MNTFLDKRIFARRWFECGIVALCSATSATAYADKPSLAEDLFDKGIQLLEQEKYERACPFIEESYRRDPLLGALIALADCEYERGHLTAALARYREYVDRHANLVNTAQAKQGSRLREAKVKVEELTSAIPTMKIMVPEEAKVAIVHVNGIRVKPNEAIPVDPGNYEVTLDVHGRRTSKTIVEAQKNQKKIVTMDLGKILPPRIPKVIINQAVDEEPFDYEADNQVRTAGVVLGTVELLGIVVVFFVAGGIALDQTGVVPPNSMSNFLVRPSPSPTSPRMTSTSTWLIPSLIAGAGTIAATTTGIVWAASQTSQSTATSKVSLLPLVSVGKSPEQPTIFGIQGRF
ncbi:MAG TPA: hypothetical protein PK156_43695 [Polyangium sp.]|nr:hypothetical protein [Polyangium sp.]